MTAQKQASNPDFKRAREQARAVIAHHFGKGAGRITAKGGGLTNFVFEVHHPDGSFIVRLSPDPAKIDAYYKEQWAMARVRAAGVPTPDVLEVGCQVVPSPYMILRSVNGAEATLHPQRERIVAEMGRYAAKIHSVKTAGFGNTFDWSQNRLSFNKTWNDFLEHELKLNARLEVLDRYAMLTPAQIHKLRAILKGVPAASLQPALNHGDLRLKNVMADPGGNLVAIIDWENCTSNLAPQWDFALGLHDLSIDEKQRFLTGYGIAETQIRETAPLVKALNIINYAPVIEQLAEKRDAVGIEQHRTRLSGALDLYSI